MTNLTPQQRKILEAFEALPLPTNDFIQQLFFNIDRVVIKKGGVYNDHPLGKEVGLIIEDKNDIEKLASLVKIVEPVEEYSCMCLGNHSFELFSGSERKAVFALHHNSSLRIWGCKSDADLANAKELIDWLGNKGYKLPLLQT
jgi:hypothetical protein